MSFISVLYFLTTKGKQAALSKGKNPSWAQVYQVFPPGTELGTPDSSGMPDLSQSLEGLTLGDLVSALRATMLQPPTPEQAESTVPGANTIKVVATEEQWALASQMAKIDREGQAVILVCVESFYPHDELAYKTTGYTGKVDRNGNPDVIDDSGEGGFDDLLSLADCLYEQSAYEANVASWKEAAEKQAGEAVQAQRLENFNTYVEEARNNTTRQDYQHLSEVQEFEDFLSNIDTSDLTQASKFVELRGASRNAIMAEKTRTRKEQEAAETQAKIDNATEWIKANAGILDESIKERFMLLIEEGMFNEHTLPSYLVARLQVERPGWEIVRDPFYCRKKYDGGNVPTSVLRKYRTVRGEFPDVWLNYYQHRPKSPWSIVANWEGKIIDLSVPVD